MKTTTTEETITTPNPHVKYYLQYQSHQPNIISSTSHTSQMIFQVPVSPAKYNFRYLLTSQILFPVPDTPAVTPATQAASATGSDPVQIWPHGGNYLHLRNHQSNSCVKKIWARVRFSRINAKIYTNCEICRFQARFFTKQLG